MPIKVDGLVDLYNEELQLQIRRFRPARTGEVHREVLVNTSKEDREQMWLTVRSAIKQMQDPTGGASPLLLRQHADGCPPVRGPPRHASFTTLT